MTEKVKIIHKSGVNPGDTLKVVFEARVVGVRPDYVQLTPLTKFGGSGGFITVDWDRATFQVMHRSPAEPLKDGSVVEIHGRPFFRSRGCWFDALARDLIDNKGRQWWEVVNHDTPFKVVYVPESE